MKKPALILAIAAGLGAVAYLVTRGGQPQGATADQTGTLSDDMIAGFSDRDPGAGSGGGGSVNNFAGGDDDDAPEILPKPKPATPRPEQQPAGQSPTAYTVTVRDQVYDVTADYEKRKQFLQKTGRKETKAGLRKFVKKQQVEVGIALAKAEAEAFAAKKLAEAQARAAAQNPPA